MQAHEDPRWQRFFADLEAEADGLERAEFEAEVAERTRSQWAGVRLAERLASVIGEPVVVHLVAGPAVHGVVVEAGRTWVLVASGAEPPRLVLLAGVEAVDGLDRSGGGSRDGVRAPGALPVTVVLRHLARDRAAVVLRLRGGAEVAGTVDRVAADHLDLAVHPPDERRPRGGPTRAVALDALLLVSPR